MNIYNYLTEEDIDKIELYIDNYGLVNASRNRTAKIDFILREWAKQKEKLFNIFGNQFILSKEIEYHEGLSKIMDKIDSELFYYHYPMYNYREDAKVYKYKFYEEADHLLQKLSKSSFNNAKNNTIWSLLHKLLTSEVLATNVYDGPTVEVSSFDEYFIEHSFKIQKGCKASKALGKIAEAFHLNGWEEFRIAHSLCLNEKTLKGKLCLSIHPLDYMTMSDNNNGWDSCMSWTAEGGYRLGTVEMMNSPIVVVAYLEDEKIDFDLSYGHTWNSKKWRELFIVDKDIICNVKGYPYCNNYFEVEVIKWLKELVEANSDIKYTTEPIHYEYGKDFYVSELETTIDFDAYTHKMYNDFGHKSHYAIFNTSLKDKNFNRLAITYSGLPECMCCGELDGYFYEESTVVCDDCANYRVCDRCNEIIDEEDAYYVDGKYLCGYCFDNYTEECIDGEYHLTDNVDHIYVTSHGKNPNGRFYFPVYDYEWNKNDLREYVNVEAIKYSDIYHKYIIDVNEVFEDGFKYLGWDKEEVEEEWFNLIF